MSESTVIANTSWPVTRERIASDLHSLGVEQGMILLVHSSLSALGWTPGGPVAVIQGLLDALGPAGTLVMPTHTGDYSEPSQWSNPPVPEAWWPVIREQTPAFDARVTPTRGMGAIPEVFRCWPGVLRSYHPHHSFAALGPQAGFITDGHTLEDSLGEGSPLARIYDRDGWVLLLGAGFGNNTSFHLAEYRQPEPRRVVDAAPILRNGERAWFEFPNVDINSDSFEALGADFEAGGEVKRGPVGKGEARLFRQRPAVDFACRWLAMRNPG